MIVDVIIPTRTDARILPLLSACVGSLRASEQGVWFNVVLVESGPEIVEVGQDVTIKFDREEFNYNHALKQGINSTSGEWVVLANNDLIFYPHWFTEILTVNSLFPSIRSFTPWNGHNGYHDFIYHGTPGNVFVGRRVCYEIGGWCIVCKREVLEAIDLSERVNLWYSDNIYADELTKHRIEHALVKSSKVNHITSQTIDFSKYDTRMDYLKYKGEW